LTPFKANSNTSKLRSSRETAMFAYLSFKGREKILPLPAIISDLMAHTGLLTIIEPGPTVKWPQVVIPLLPYATGTI
jgi:hypothetical protein